MIHPEKKPALGRFELSVTAVERGTWANMSH